MSRRVQTLLLALLCALACLSIPGVVLSQTTRSGFKPTPGSTAVWTLPLNDAAGCFQSDGSGGVTLSVCSGAPGIGDITAVGSCTTGACFTAGAPSADLTLNNATSGTITLQAVTGALGARTISFPAETGTVCTTGSICSGYQATVPNVIDGTGAANKVAYWSDANTLTQTTLFHFTGAFLGVGTASPVAAFHSSRDDATAISLADRYSGNAEGSGYIGRKARGTAASPTQVLANDSLSLFGGVGYQSGGAFATHTSGEVGIYAAENFTASAQGTYMNFSTVATGAVASSANLVERMRITAAGYVGIGEDVPLGPLHIATNDAVNIFYLDRHTATTGGAAIVGRKARGTIASPTQTLSGDTIFAIGGMGYQSGGAFATTLNAAMIIGALENFTSTGQGAEIIFGTTPVGSITRANRVTITSEGKVRIEDLKTTGAAAGKTVVCVDVVTGQLYPSSSGVACAN